MECIGLVVDCVVGSGVCWDGVKGGSGGTPPMFLSLLGLRSRPKRAVIRFSSRPKTTHRAQQTASPEKGVSGDHLCSTIRTIAYDFPRPPDRTERRRRNLASIRRTNNAVNYKKGACIAIVC